VPVNDIVAALEQTVLSLPEFTIGPLLTVRVAEFEFADPQTLPVTTTRY
jgi:hypothetical protein